jgi:hypothetical protein
MVRRRRARNEVKGDEHGCPLGSGGAIGICALRAGYARWDIRFAGYGDILPVEGVPTSY